MGNKEASREANRAARVVAPNLQTSRAIRGATVAAADARAVTLALSSGLGGLLCSYHFDLPSGPAIILFAGSLYLFSLLFAPAGGVLPRLIRQRHLAH